MMNHRKLEYCLDPKPSMLPQALCMTHPRVFLKPPTNRPPTTDQPTTDQVHRPPANQPSTNKKYEDQKSHKKF